MTVKTLTPDNMDFFYTPSHVASQMSDLIRAWELESKHIKTVLEPSAGEGHLSTFLTGFLNIGQWQVTCVEADDTRIDMLRRRGWTAYHADFKKWVPGRLYDLIFMNPPFEKDGGIAHVKHAFDHCLHSDGELIAIMMDSVVWREQNPFKSFREEYLDKYATDIVYLEPDAFEEAGTRVRTVIVRMTKTGILFMKEWDDRYNE